MNYLQNFKSEVSNPQKSKKQISQFLKLVNYQYKIQRISLSLQHFRVSVQKLLTQETSASQINEKKIQVNVDIHIEIETTKYNLEFAVCTCIFTCAKNRGEEKERERGI